MALKTSTLLKHCCDSRADSMGKPNAKNVQTYPINLTAQSGNPGVNGSSKQSKSSPKVPAKEASSLYDFAALDGLRVVACLSVICFHSLLYWGTLLDINDGEKVRIFAIFMFLTSQYVLWQFSKTRNFLFSRRRFQLLNRVPVLRLAVFGNAGVDIFLVLTGLWATWQLVPAMETACAKGAGAEDGKNSAWPAVKEYYR